MAPFWLDYAEKTSNNSGKYVYAIVIYPGNMIKMRSTEKSTARE